MIRRTIGMPMVNIGWADIDGGEFEAMFGGEAHPAEIGPEVQ